MPNISEYPRPTLTYFTGLVDVLVGMIFQVFLWRSPKGCCYGNQLDMGDVRKRRWSDHYCLLRHSTTDWPIVNLLSACSMAIRYIMSKFGELLSSNSEFYAVKRAIFARSARNLTTIFFRHIGVSKRIGRSQF